MKPITFSSGFNIIYGDVESNKDKEEHEHNLGKTSLVHLIDFLLLAKVTKGDFFYKHKETFIDWVFFLEIEKNDGTFITIRRDIIENTRVSMIIHEEKSQDFSNEDVEWTVKNLSINAKNNEDNAKVVLQKLLNINLLEYPYRKFLSYALRTQHDYRDVFRMDKFRGKDSGWKPYLFSLLGFEGKNVEEKYKVHEQINDLKSYIGKLKKENSVQEQDLYVLKAAKEAKEIEQSHIKDNIDKFNFYLKEQDLNSKLVEEVEESIAKLNSEEYSLSYKVESIESSLKASINFNLEDVIKIFEETKIYFPKALETEYSDLIYFNEQLSNERSKYLKEELKSAKENLDEIKSKLKELNEKQSEILSLLVEKDAFTKFKKYQTEIIEVESEVKFLQKQIESIDAVQKYDKQIEELENNLKDFAKKIKKDINSGNQIFTSIKEVFGEIFRQTLHATALIVVSPNKEGNPEFTTHILSSDLEKITGQGDGYTATKVQCAAFVMSVLKIYSNNPFIRFAYHDGIFEGWGNNPKIAFIKYTRDLTMKNDLQYIVSMIKSDIPTNFEFKDGEIITILDRNNTLFGIDF